MSVSVFAIFRGRETAPTKRESEKVEKPATGSLPPCSLLLCYQ